MKQKWGVAIAVAIGIFSPIHCGAESSRGTCKFSSAEVVAKLDYIPPPLSIVRRDGDPSAIQLIDYGDVSSEKSKVRTIRIDTATGHQSNETMPYDGTGRSWPPPGYTPFQSGERGPDVHPIIRNGLLRFEYFGRTASVPFLQRSFEGKWSVDHDDVFTGTRRMTYGGQVLVEQDFTNYSELGHLFEFVQIEPDGDRIVCMCQNSSGNWIGVFSKRKLDAKSRSAK